VAPPRCSGDVAAMILFSRTPVPADTATRFRSIALDMKASLFRFGPGEMFDAAT
jgi:hypothetical protein